MLNLAHSLSPFLCEMCGCLGVRVLLCLLECACKGYQQFTFLRLRWVAFETISLEVCRRNLNSTQLKFKFKFNNANTLNRKKGDKQEKDERQESCHRRQH